MDDEKPSAPKASAPKSVDSGQATVSIRAYAELNKTKPTHLANLLARKKWTLDTLKPAEEIATAITACLKERI